jgi:hypothetical protein
MLGPACSLALLYFKSALLNPAHDPFFKNSDRHERPYVFQKRDAHLDSNHHEGQMAQWSAVYQAGLDWLRIGNLNPLGGASPGAKVRQKLLVKNSDLVFRAAASERTNGPFRPEPITTPLLAF